MAKTRRAEAFWDARMSRWKINVQRDGVRKTFVCSEPGKKGKHIAEAKADEWLANERGDEIRFPDAWEKFLEWHKKHNGSQNYVKHEAHGRLYIIPTIGNRKLSSISAAKWQVVIDAAAANGLSQRSCQNVRATITAFMRYVRLERWEHVQVGSDDIKIPKSAAPKKEKHVLTRDELKLLFSDPTIIHYGKPEVCQYAYAWRFLVATGLRRGELAGLKKSDIVNGVLHVRRSINSLREVTAGKTENAMRDFLISDNMRMILYDQQMMLKSKGIISPYIFPDENGECTDPKRIYNQWNSYKKQHALQGTLHEMRHTFISMNKADMPPELLKQVVGHSVNMDTFAVYGHEIDGDKKRAAAIMDETLDNLIRE